MCGIVCYIGKQEATSILIEGLKRLEYRGYDSAGLAVTGPDETFLIKEVGKVNRLDKKVQEVHPHGTMGIAHTRWATHGRPTVENAHPHTGENDKIFLVHNGIIENYIFLKEELIEKGHTFKSQTDTEVLVHLIEEYYEGDLEQAVKKALALVQGTFGIALFHRDNPDKIVLARRGSPLVLGIGENEFLAASDVNALIRYTNKVVHLNDNELAVLNRSDYHITDFQDRRVTRELETIEWDQAEADKKGFDHFMLKEIFEQPETVKNALRGRILEGEGVPRLGGLESVLDRMKSIEKVHFISCGTSYYAGLLARYVFEKLTNLSVEVEYASEFRYRSLRLDEKTAVLAISQSGETADTLAAIREGRRKGALCLGLVNVVGSTIAKETDAGVYNHAGPEIGVASTKVFISQSVILTLMALLIGRYQRLSLSDGLFITNALNRLPAQIKSILNQADQIQEIARQYARYEDFLFIGRLCNFPIAMEGALKLKEISYIHAEGYAAGEMKHGPISLITPNFPTVAIVPRDSTYNKMVSNIQEIKARDGKVIAIAVEGDDHITSHVDHTIHVPHSIDIIQPLINTIPLQLFAYYVAQERGCSIDKPRNLAKSVTVE
ncbi:MAG: glutamine--fructose-6-phosphate transaminase (isomerizing) [Candidatus Auribacterota bacterium]|nr:glutamine--fructose-6-phosphate transaminase (isomerizing) [Candidatus Auribacterota bacterium]